MTAPATRTRRPPRDFGRSIARATPRVASDGAQNRHRMRTDGQARAFVIGPNTVGEDMDGSGLWTGFRSGGLKSAGYFAA